MNRKLVLRIVLLCLGIVALAGTAFGFSLLFSYQGTVAAYDFGGFGPGHDTPGTVEIQAFTLDPGENVPWHYHKGLSYVVLVQGNLTEQELSRDGGCAAPRSFKRGAAFVETPGRWHTVTNTGNGTAIVYWATVYPKGDPDGDAVFVNPPSCN
jgi:quercetin dioxygenase-like cupin family protein